MPAEAFSAAGIQREAAQAQLVAGPSVAGDAMSTDRAAEHTLRGISLTRRLLEYGYSPKRSAGERFRMRRMLGAGANGDVFAVDDCNLDREIAVK
nr:hypothetical protein [Gemmatimonadales bacterium]